MNAPARNPSASVCTLVRFVFATAAASQATVNGALNLNGATRAVSVANGAAAVDLAFSGPITGTGGLTKKGTGLLSLAGANTYSGATAVNGGTLRLLGSVTSNVTVNKRGTLDGNGKVIGNLSVLYGATLAPGADGAGSLTVTGNAYLGDGSVFLVQLRAGLGGRGVTSVDLAHHHAHGGLRPEGWAPTSYRAKAARDRPGASAEPGGGRAGVAGAGQLRREGTSLAKPRPALGLPPPFPWYLRSAAAGRRFGTAARPVWLRRASARRRSAPGPKAASRRRTPKVRTDEGPANRAPAGAWRTRCPVNGTVPAPATEAHEVASLGSTTRSVDAPFTAGWTAPRRVRRRGSAGWR